MVFNYIKFLLFFFTFQVLSCKSTNNEIIRKDEIKGGLVDIEASLGFSINHTRLYDLELRKKVIFDKDGNEHKVNFLSYQLSDSQSVNITLCSENDEQEERCEEEKKVKLDFFIILGSGNFVAKLEPCGEDFCGEKLTLDFKIEEQEKTSSNISDISGDLHEYYTRLYEVVDSVKNCSLSSESSAILTKVLDPFENNIFLPIDTEHTVSYDDVYYDSQERGGPYNKKDLFKIYNGGRYFAFVQDVISTKNYSWNEEFELIDRDGQPVSSGQLKEDVLLSYQEYEKKSKKRKKKATANKKESSDKSILLGSAAILTPFTLYAISKSKFYKNLTSPIKKPQTPIVSSTSPSKTSFEDSTVRKGIKRVLDSTKLTRTRAKTASKYLGGAILMTFGIGSILYGAGEKEAFLLAGDQPQCNEEINEDIDVLDKRKTGLSTRISEQFVMETL